VQGKTYQLFRLAQVGIIKSGTSTLEAALFRVPQVVCYKGDYLSYKIARWVVGSRIRYISLVNLILNRPAVRELIQHELTPQAIVQELETLVPGGSARPQVLAEYETLWQTLGNAGASQQAANLIAAALPTPT
jgi:lipid-A-disaccharide synthase